MSSCNIFQEKIVAFGAEIEAIASLLKTYPALGSQEILDEVKKRTQALRAERLRFFEEEYVPRVKATMSTWYSLEYVITIGGRNDFVSAMRINEKGRITLVSESYINIGRRREGTVYFPHLIESIIGKGVNFLECSLVEGDYLSSVSGYLVFADAQIASMNGLRRIGRGLTINSGDIPPFPRLEEIHGYVFLGSMPVENFRAYFPQLREVGTDDRGVSFALSEQNAHLKEQLERLRAEGSLIFDGDIRIVVT